MHVCAVCATDVCVGVCGSVDMCAGTLRFNFLFYFIRSARCLLLLLPYRVVCITPYLKLSSSLLCGSHGTTAVAKQVCVDYFYARVSIAYLCVMCVL